MVFSGIRLFTLYKNGNEGGKTHACRAAHAADTHLLVPRLIFALDIEEILRLPKLQTKLNPLTINDQTAINRAKITYQYPDIINLLVKLSSAGKKCHLNNIPLDLLFSKITEFL